MALALTQQACNGWVPLGALAVQGVRQTCLLLAQQPKY